MLGVAGDICFTMDVISGVGKFPGFDFWNKPFHFNSFLIALYYLIMSLQHSEISLNADEFDPNEIKTN